MPALAAAVALGLAGGVAAGVAAALALRRWEQSARARADAAEWTARIALCEALAAELRAGRPPAAALHAAASGSEVLSGTVTSSPWLGLVRGGSAGGEVTGATVLRRAAGAAQLGGDVPAVLLSGPAAGTRRGELDALHQLAVCWAVAERSGAGLEVAVRRLTEGLRGQERLRAEMRAELAPARATARLLAFLPGLGLLLAAAVGAQPAAFLLGTPLGAACLLGALALDAAGLAWTRHLTRGAAARPARTGPAHKGDASIGPASGGPVGSDPVSGGGP